MKTQIIYTFQDQEQEIFDFENLTKEDLQFKSAFIDIVTSELKESQKQELIKISACVTLEENENINPPKWYLDCNGKFYFENGQLI